MNPLAVDLAKVSLWLVTAASRFPLSFLDHRLRCGNSLLGIPAEEVVRPWVRPAPKKKSKAKPKAIKPVELLISPKGDDEVFEFAAPSHKALCQSFTRAFACLRELNKSVQQEPTNFELHQARHAALRGTIQPWWEAHQLRVGCAFSQEEVNPDIINDWLRDLVDSGKVRDEQREKGQSFVDAGEDHNGFCWEMAFPEIFFGTDGRRRDGAGFSCVLGNPPWDKIKPERDGFYLAYDPLIRQYQGTTKNERIAELHEQTPNIKDEWERFDRTSKSLASTLLDSGIFQHQTAIIEEEVEDENGEAVVKRKTSGGDPDCFKFFLERAWQLAASGHAVGMVMSSSLHSGQGGTGLRRLLIGNCDLKAFVKFDNELRVFPGVHNQFKFDIVVFEKDAKTTAVDAAFFSRETEQALQGFRKHRCYLRIPAEEIRELAPQTLTLFEFRSQRDVDLVQKAYRIHPRFGDGLMNRLRLKFRREFDSGNRNYLFHTRDWLERHGCVPEYGQRWKAETAEWYRGRNYVERPVIEWYVLYQEDKVVAHRLPWAVKSSKAIRESDLDDFDVRLQICDRFRLLAKKVDDGGSTTVFVPVEDVRDTDFPAHIPAAKKLKGFTFSRAIRPHDVFLPLMEGKWIYHLNDRAYAYVSGAGSWVVTRPMDHDEYEVIPHYFMSSLDARTRTPPATAKIGCRDVSGTANERTMIAAAIPGDLPCNDATPTFSSNIASDSELTAVVAWLSSLVNDYIFRMTGGRAKLYNLKGRPAPCERLIDSVSAMRLVGQFVGFPSQDTDESVECTDDNRALLDAVMAEVTELPPHEYCRVVSTFPLLDRDQPPLPHDYRIRVTSKGIEWRKISFITRDLALLTYFDYLAGRLDVKPDPERVQRICPDGVPDPPNDIVEFFTEAGVDIDGRTDYAVAATGPHRSLRERVAKARELGAVAYVPTVDRRRATFVEEAAAAGGLSPEEGVLTPEMADRVLRDKAERDAKWQRAMELWDETPDPRAEVPNENQSLTEMKSA